MEPVKHVSKIDQTEAALLAGIDSGRWQGMLPSVRMLREALKVSPPTIQAAVARLCRRGVLVSQGPRRRPLISRPGRSGDGKGEAGARGRDSEEVPITGRQRRVLCVSNEPLNLLPQSSLEIFTRLRMENPDWDLRHRVLAFEGARRARQQWGRLFDLEEPDHVIVFQANPVLARWALARNVPVVAIGGETGDLSIPVIGWTPVPLLRESISRLAARGHVRICLPIIGIFPRLAAALQETVAETMGECDLPFDAKWNAPVASERSPDVLLNVLERVFAKEVPTALIAMSFVELTAIGCFLREHRLRVPRDVSLIALAITSPAEWFRPMLSHFILTTGGVTKRVRRWIEEGAHGEETSVRLSGRFVEGDSVAAPPAVG